MRLGGQHSDLLLQSVQKLLYVLWKQVPCMLMDELEKVDTGADG